MYTSAPNNLSDGKAGYVHFLKECIELYCKTPGIYDKILHRNNVVAGTSSCGATIKDLGNVLLTYQQRKVLCGNDSYKRKKMDIYVNRSTRNILMVDDKPSNIRRRSGSVAGVPQYEYECNGALFNKCINSVFNLRKKLEYYKDPDDKTMTVRQGIIKEADANNKRFFRDKNNASLVKIIKSIRKYYG